MNKYIVDANLSADAPYNVIRVMSPHHRYTLPPPPIFCQPKELRV